MNALYNLRSHLLKQTSTSNTYSTKICGIQAKGLKT